MRIPYRFLMPLSLAVPVVIAMAAAVAVARGGTALLALGGLAALAMAAVAVSVKPAHLFLFWLFLAPFMQDLGTSRPAHLIRIAVYSAPPILFLAWTFLHRRSVRGSFVDVLPAGWVAYAVASAILAGVNVSSTQIFAIVGTGVIVYYFCAFCSLGEGIEHKVAHVLLASTALVSIVVEVGKVAGHNYGYQADTAGGVERAVGPLGSSGVLGAVVGAGIAIALAVLVWGGPRSLRRLAIGSLLVNIPALVLTFTRGPLIAAGAVCLLILVSRARTRWPTALAGIVVALAVAGLWTSIASTSVYRDRFSNQSNVEERVVIDRWSLELAGRKPLFGWGYGSFDKVKDAAHLPTGSSTVTYADVIPYTSHNTFLTILVELGGVGLCLLLVPWIVVAFSSLRVIRANQSDAWLVVGFLGVLGIWSINAGTYDMRFFSLAWVLPWLAVGVLRRMVLDRVPAREPTRERSAHEHVPPREAFSRP